MIETKNILIRESTWEDIEDFYQWEQTSEVTKFFSIKDGQTKEDVVRKYVEDDNDPTAKQFTIFLKQDSGLNRIGRIVLAEIEEGWKAELWRVYIADPKIRGKGYGREAMIAIIKYCFEDLNLERFYLDHYTGNPAGELYLSLGFTYEGVLRKNCRKNGVLYDVHLMSMLRDEYKTLY